MISIYIIYGTLLCIMPTTTIVVTAKIIKKTSLLSYNMSKSLYNNTKSKIC